MKTQFEILKITRENILSIIKTLSLEQLNTIPGNYNNSIGWQIAHIVVTQQLLNYKLAEQETLISEKLISNFKKGSSGKYIFTLEEWNEVKQLMTELPLKLMEDYNNNLFQNYADYPTSYNFIITSIEKAITFNNIHEAMHFGTISAMKKMI